MDGTAGGGGGGRRRRRHKRRHPGRRGIIVVVDRGRHAPADRRATISRRRARAPFPDSARGCPSSADGPWHRNRAGRCHAAGIVHALDQAGADGLKRIVRRAPFFAIAAARRRRRHVAAAASQLGQIASFLLRAAGGAAGSCGSGRRGRLGLGDLAGIAVARGDLGRANPARRADPATPGASPWRSAWSLRAATWPAASVRIACAPARWRPDGSSCGPAASSR